MPSMLVGLSRAHLEELSLRTEARPRFYPDAREVPLDALLPDPRGPLLAGDELTDFVQRCIGTALELLDHQARGGALLLEYPDGTLREMTVNLGVDGTGIPRSVDLGRSRRLWRRRPGPRTSA